MAESIVGLHIYSVTQHKKRNKIKIEFSKNGDGARLRDYADRFFRLHSTPDDDENNSRTWFFEPKPNNGNSYHGIIRYGSSGYESDIIDRKSRDLNYKRKVTDIDVIPLYYRLWVPSAGEFALLALQTFGQRSCVNRVQSALIRGYSANNNGHLIVVKPIVPTKLKNFRNAEVKSINLRKLDYSSDSAENQIGSQSTLVDLDVSFTAKPRRNLGLLGSLAGRIQSAAGKDVLSYNDTQFDEATAEVSLDGKRRRVTLIGVDRNAGKFDLTEDIRREPNGHPEFNSISSEVESLFTGIATGDAG